MALLQSFEKSLEVGKVGELMIQNWFESKGFCAFATCLMIGSDNKGPRVNMYNGQKRVAPDLLVFNDKKMYWIEAKNKNAFTYYRKTDTFQTGINLNHYNDYVEINKNFPHDIWILFLQREGVAKDSNKGPSGLYGDTITELLKKIDHKTDEMVYWNEKDLTKIDTYQNVLEPPINKKQGETK